MPLPNGGIYTGGIAENGSFFYVYFCKNRVDSDVPWIAEL
jgi:hypothetical protein